MRSSSILALDCGASHIACGLFSTGPDGNLRLEQYAIEAFVIDPMDEAKWTHALGQALEAILARVKFSLSECVITVPGHLALTKLIKTPSVDRDKRSRILQFEASQNIPYPLEEVAWGQLEVSDNGVDLEFMLSAAKLDTMESLCSVVELAGLKVTRCETTSLALWRAHDWCHGSKASPVLLVDIGARSTHLIYVGPNSIHLRTLSMGGNAITQALAGQLQMDFTTAEQHKLSILTAGTPGQTDAISREILMQAKASFADKLLMEITRSRLSYLRRGGAEAPEKIYLAGKGAQLTGLSALMSEILELPVEPFSLLAKLDMSDRARFDGAGTVAEQLVNLIGMAMPLLHRDAALLDLLPPPRREALAWRRRQPWWLMAAGLMVLVLVPPIIYYQTAVSRLNRQVIVIDELAGPMMKIETTNAANIDRLNILHEQIDSIRGLALSRTNWVGFLADLQTRLGEVEDVWLERMQVVAEVERTSDPDSGSAPLRLALGGKLLDTEKPLGAASGHAYAKVKALFNSLHESPYVRAVKEERFDSSQSGVLHFEVTLIMDPEHPL